MSQSAAAALADGELVFDALPTHSAQAVLEVRNTGGKAMVYQIDTNSTPALHCDTPMGCVPAGGTERVPIRWSGSQRGGHDRRPHCDIHTAVAPAHAMSATCVQDNYWRIVNAINEDGGAMTKLRVEHRPEPASAASSASGNTNTASSTSMTATSAASRTTAVTRGATSTDVSHSTVRPSYTATAAASAGDSTTLSAFDRAHMATLSAFDRAHVEAEPPPLPPAPPPSFASSCGDSATQLDEATPRTHSTLRSSESAVHDDDATVPDTEPERDAASLSSSAAVEEATQPAAVSARRPPAVSLVSEAASADRRSTASLRHRMAQWLERTIRGPKQSTNEELAERSLRGGLKADDGYVQRCRRLSWRHRLADLVFGRYEAVVKSVTERHNATSSAASPPPSSAKRGGVLAWLRAVFAGGQRHKAAERV